MRCPFGAPLGIYCSCPEGATSTNPLWAIYCSCPEGATTLSCPPGIVKYFAVSSLPLRGPFGHILRDAPMGQDRQYMPKGLKALVASAKPNRRGPFGLLCLKGGMRSPLWGAQYMPYGLKAKGCPEGIYWAKRRSSST